MSVVTRYLCSSPYATGEITVKNLVVCKTPPIWNAWCGAVFDIFLRRCHIDKYEELKD